MLGGWVAALLLVLGIAGAVRFFGETGEGALPLAGSSSGPAGSPLPIAFGTVLTSERLVPVEARTTTFRREDTFAYAVEDAPAAEQVFVAVARTDRATPELVQEPVAPQSVTGTPARIAFSVSAGSLLDAWGPGAYVMRVHLQPDGPAIAEGEFVLVEATTSP